MSVTWEQIRSQFTDEDVVHMLRVTNNHLNLADCQSVRQNASEIFQRVSDGSMPPGSPWPAQWIKNFADWMVDGSPCPDVEMGATEVSIAASARGVTGPANPDSIPVLTAALESASYGPAGVECLKKSLRAAIKLEFATIPPYLTAMWSIKEPTDPVKITIFGIVLEEMGHMGLACNMLVALGESPALATPGFVPTFPGPLPGDVHPGLTVGLRRLTPSQLKTFMDIEYPEGGPITALAARAFETIGAFYAALLKAFVTVNPVLDTTRQRENIETGVFVLKNLDDVRTAIDQIRRQGEGSKQSPNEPDGEVAHFYKFREVYVGSKYILDPVTNTWGHTGPPVLMPEVRPMADIPAGGYQKADVPDAVWQLIDSFDVTFTLMLHQLAKAWNDPTAPLGVPTDPNDPINTMGSLHRIGQKLMDAKRPDKLSTYGPCFRLI